MVVLLGVPIGVVVGAVIGVIGAGGSMLTVPLLVYAVGMPLRQATATEQVIVLLSSMAALVPRRAQVDWRVAGVVAGIGVPFTALGGMIGRHIGNAALSMCFVGVMLVAAVLILRRPGSCRPHTVSAGLRSRLIPILATGAGVSVLAGLLGIGGGFLLVPGLMLLLNMDAASAVATSLVIVVVTASASIIGRPANSTTTAHDGHGLVQPLPWLLTLTLAATAVVVSLSVSRYAVRIPDHILRRCFATIVMTVACYMTVTTLSPIFDGAVPGNTPSATHVRLSPHRRRQSDRRELSRIREKTNAAHP